MIEHNPIDDSFHMNMERMRKLLDNFPITGMVDYQLYRKGELIIAEKQHNLVTDNAKLQVLDGFFRKQLTPQNGFVLSLIDNSGYSGIATSDTYTDHPGWTEFDAYIADTGALASYRGFWTPCPAVSGKTYNVTPITFTFTGNGTVKGIFVAATGSTGVGKNDWDSLYGLWGMAVMTTPLVVEIDDILKVVYTVQL